MQIIPRLQKNSSLKKILKRSSLSSRITTNNNQQKRIINAPSIYSIMVSRLMTIMDEEDGRRPILETSTIKRSVAHRSVGLITLSTNVYIVGYVLHGEKNILVGKNVFRYYAGETYFLSVGRHFIKERPSKEERFEEILLCISREDVCLATADLQKAVNFNPVSPCLSCTECTTKRFFPIKQSEALSAYFNFLDKIMVDCSEIKNGMALKLHFAALIFVLFTRMDKCVRGKMLGGNEKDDIFFKKRVYGFIFQPMTVENIAAAMGYSLSHFKTKFRALFGATPHKWILMERLKNAKFLLTSTALSIAAIGQNCMFRSITHFSKCFKETYGITPSEYRKRAINMP